VSGHSHLWILFVFLATAVIIVPIFRRIGLGSVLGYLAAGSLLGPWGFRVVSDVKSILEFSELGVVFLLFVIGLELQPSRLWAMRRAVFGLGSAQLLLTSLILVLIGKTLGLSFAVATVAALALSLSSTAFTLQALAERKALNTSYGRASFAILLFQDLAVIPILGIIPLLGGEEILAKEFFFSLLKVILVIATISIGGRYLLRPGLRLVASARVKEVFVAATLLVVLGAALIMDSAGLSMALGTFLAGVLLADSEYRHELETDIEPFKGLLLGLFFMAIGMSVDYGIVLQKPLFLLATTLGFMTVKVIVVYFLGRTAKFSHESATNMAMALPQGGEFAFVLFGVATKNKLFGNDVADFLVVAVTLSMALAPLLMALNEKFLCKGINRGKEVYDAIPDEGNPVIIAGFGRFGQITGRLLRAKGIGFTALEQDPEQVHLVRRFGGVIYYGDASRLDLLEMAGTAKAKVFVLAIDDVEASLQTARVVKARFPHLQIFARARNRQHVFDLMKIGVQVIFRETFGSGLEMAHKVLLSLGMSEEKAEISIKKFREHDEQSILEQFPHSSDETQLINHSKQSTQQLAELFKTDKA
jgi:monovalent cation:proton antiporter-2 (CPA2) family protein